MLPELRTHPGRSKSMGQTASGPCRRPVARPYERVVANQAAAAQSQTCCWMLETALACILCILHSVAWVAPAA